MQAERATRRKETEAPAQGPPIITDQGGGEMHQGSRDRKTIPHSDLSVSHLSSQGMVLSSAMCLVCVHDRDTCSDLRELPSTRGVCGAGPQGSG